MESSYGWTEYARVTDAERQATADAIAAFEAQAAAEADRDRPAVSAA